MTSARIDGNGVYLLELLAVLGLVMIAAAVAWPRAAISNAPSWRRRRALALGHLLGRITAQTQGRVVEMRRSRALTIFDPPNERRAAAVRPEALSFGLRRSRSRRRDLSGRRDHV
jgi:hypothetical protein